MRSLGLVSLGLLVLAGCAATTEFVPVYSPVYAIDEGNPRVVVLGDTQRTMWSEFWRERNSEKTRALLGEVARRQPAVIVHLGDLTCYGGSARQWAWFDTVNRSIGEKAIPCAPVLGNHEYYGLNATALESLRRRFPAVPPEQTWYSFSHHGVGWILLNSNFGELSAAEIDVQQDWYLAELDRMENDPRITWIVVACHHPPFTNSRVISPSREVRARLVPPFEHSRKGVLFFSGHCHSYEHFEQGGKTFIVSGGGGGPRHHLQTNPDKRRSPDLFSGPAIRFFHFAELTLEGNSLRLDILRLNDDATFSPADSLSIPPPHPSPPASS